MDAPEGKSGTSTISGSVSGTANPQVASYSVTLPRPGNVSVEFGPDTSYGFSTSEQHTPATGDRTVNILVAGMKANTAYHMRAKVDYDDGGSITDADLTFTTGALPAGILPNVTVIATSGLTPQPGVELVDSITAPYQVPFATDLQGNVIWTYNPPEARQATELIYPVKLLPNGHYMCLIAPNFSDVLSTVPASEPDLIREFDLAGNTIRQLTMADLNAKLVAANMNVTLQVFNHDFTELPNGHILVIANTLKQFTNLQGIPGASTVLGDVVIDLDTNLDPVWLWNEFDHLDVNRHPYLFPDWTHSNAVTYSPDDGNFLVSMRHQNWIVKVDYRDGAGAGNVLWRLGEGGDFTLQGGVDPTDWFYAKHDVNFVSANTTGSFKLAIMDNGDDRIFPTGVTCGAAGAPACLYTTIPIMQVDENAKTASFLFHQILPTNLYSFFAGSTRVLPNTNVEYNLAGVGSTAATFEVTPTATPQTVWQMNIGNSNTYRSYRMPSLYPGIQW
jgi:arylsulfate sulfotransferase